MAGKPRNRLELRRQYEAAEPLDPMESDEAEEVVDASDDGEDEPKPKKKARPAAKKAKPAKAAKAAKPAARVRIVWQVVNDAFKTVATFEFAQKEAAEAKAAEMTAKGKGTHFVQKLKEPMPDDAPGLGASIPRTAVETVTARREKAEILDDDNDDDEPDEEPDDEPDDDDE